MSFHLVQTDSHCAAAWKLRWSAFALLATFYGVAPGASRAQEYLPEPDITYRGTVPAGSQVAIDHSAGQLGSASAGGGQYEIAVRLVQPLTDDGEAIPPPPAGSAYIGDPATFVVNGIAQGQVVLQERGAVYVLDIPNPVGVPAPTEPLSPIQVTPGIPDVTPTPTGQLTATPTPTPSDTTPGASATPTPTETPPLLDCVGDCNGDGRVAINELITGVNIALQQASLELCPSFDVNGDERVAINELITGVNNALQGCAEEL